MKLPTDKISTEFVASRDGTKISYLKTGSGPGLILVHGGLMSSQNFGKLGGLLAESFTVYIPDRQGRGLSEARTMHDLLHESEDMQALVNKTDAENIFGLSSGAIVALRTAIGTSSLKKVALYEPPIALDLQAAKKWYAAYELAISKGNFGKAFVCVMKVTGDNSWLSKLPSFLVTGMINFAIKRQKLKEGEVPLQSLLEAFKYDYRIVKESKEMLSDCAGISANVLLLGGTTSPSYLLNGLDQLELLIPNVGKIKFPGLGHMAADNSGKPEVIASELKRFFLC